MAQSSVTCLTIFHWDFARDPNPLEVAPADAGDVARCTVHQSTCVRCDRLLKWHSIMAGQVVMKINHIVAPTEQQARLALSRPPVSVVIGPARPPHEAWALLEAGELVFPRRPDCRVRNGAASGEGSSAPLHASSCLPASRPSLSAAAVMEAVRNVSLSGGQLLPAAQRNAACDAQPATGEASQPARSAPYMSSVERATQVIAMQQAAETPAAGTPAAAFNTTGHRVPAHPHSATNGWPRMSGRTRLAGGDVARGREAWVREALERVAGITRKRRRPDAGAGPARPQPPPQGTAADAEAWKKQRAAAPATAQPGGGPPSPVYLLAHPSAPPPAAATASLSAPDYGGASQPGVDPQQLAHRLAQGAAAGSAPSVPARSKGRSRSRVRLVDPPPSAPPAAARAAPPAPASGGTGRPGVRSQQPKHRAKKGATAGSAPLQSASRAAGRRRVEPAAEAVRPPPAQAESAPGVHAARPQEADGESGRASRSSSLCSASSTDSTSSTSSTSSSDGEKSSVNGGGTPNRAVGGSPTDSGTPGSGNGGGTGGGTPGSSSSTSSSSTSSSSTSSSSSSSSGSSSSSSSSGGPTGTAGGEGGAGNGHTAATGSRRRRVGKRFRPHPRTGADASAGGKPRAGASAQGSHAPVGGTAAKGVGGTSAHGPKSARRPAIAPRQSPQPSPSTHGAAASARDPRHGPPQWRAAPRRWEGEGTQPSPPTQAAQRALAERATQQWRAGASMRAAAAPNAESVSWGGAREVAHRHLGVAAAEAAAAAMTAAAAAAMARSGMEQRSGRGGLGGRGWARGRGGRGGRGRATGRVMATARGGRSTVQSAGMPSSRYTGHAAPSEPLALLQHPRAQSVAGAGAHMTWIPIEEVDRTSAHGASAASAAAAATGTAERGPGRGQHSHPGQHSRYPLRQGVRSPDDGVPLGLASPSISSRLRARAPPPLSSEALDGPIVNPTKPSSRVGPQYQAAVPDTISPEFVDAATATGKRHGRRRGSRAATVPEGGGGESPLHPCIGDLVSASVESRPTRQRGAVFDGPNAGGAQLGTLLPFTTSLQRLTALTARAGPGGGARRGASRAPGLTASFSVRVACDRPRTPGRAVANAGAAVFARALSRHGPRWSKVAAEIGPQVTAEDAATYYYGTFKQCPEYQQYKETQRPSLVHDSEELRCLVGQQDEVCAGCCRPGRLVLCDSCQRGYHLKCARPLLREPPEGIWLCHHCRSAK